MAGSQIHHDRQSQVRIPNHYPTDAPRSRVYLTHTSHCTDADDLCQFLAVK